MTEPSGGFDESLPVRAALASDPVWRACRVIARSVHRLRDARVSRTVRDLLACPYPGALARRWKPRDIRPRWRQLVAAGLCPPSQRAEAYVLELCRPERRTGWRAMSSTHTVDGVAFGVALLAAPGAHATHHVYPGGLILHTALNLQAALGISDAVRRPGGGAVARDAIIAAQLLHDVMKAHLLRWQPDGHPSEEQQLGGTWAHHILMLAEGLTRDLPPQILQAAASVHADPSAHASKVTAFLRAAALLAGADPDANGLLRPRTIRGAVPGPHGWVLALSPSTEDWISRAAEEVWMAHSVRTLSAVRHAFRAAAQEGRLEHAWPPAGSSSEWWAQNLVLTIETELRLSAAFRAGLGAFAKDVRAAFGKLQTRGLWPDR